MNVIGRTLTLAPGLALVLIVAACGSGVTEPDPIRSPTPTPIVRTVILTGSVALPSRTVDVEPFSVSSPGTVDITVDWTYSASPIGVYVVRGVCDLDQFNARACDFLTRSETRQKPRLITLPNVAAGNYFLLLANFADDSESLSMQVGHSTGGAASSTRAESAGAHDGDARFSRAINALTRR
jgi:hypothetical protein